MSACVTRLLEAVHSAVQLVASWCGVAVEPVKTKSVWGADVFVWRVCESPGGFVYVDVGRGVLCTCCTPVRAPTPNNIAAFV